MRFSSSFTWVTITSVLACLGLVAAQPNENGDDNDDGRSSSSTATTNSTVLINLTGHKTIPMEISSDGTLASYTFEEPLGYVSASVVRENEHAVCFLWRQETEDTIYTHTAQWVSISFSAERQLPKPFIGAQRLYCFDNSRDQADGNIYTLFVENYEGDKELVRVRVPAGKHFSELSLVNEYPQLRVGPRASLVDAPGIGQVSLGSYDADQPGCYLRATGDRQSPLVYRTSMVHPYMCFPDEVIDGIICFRKH